MVIDKLRDEFKNKRVLVVGLGLQGGGVGVVNFFSKLGAKVTVTDKKNHTELKLSIKKIKKNKNLKLVLGKHDLKDFINQDLIIKGPSVPWNLPEIIEAKKHKIPILMEIPFFFKYSPTQNIIGITGTRGKSTTTNLIFSLLKKSGFNVFLGGNIPNISTISLLEKLHEDDWIVLELSSWSLSGMKTVKMSPHISVFTNLYPDHLNYYKDMNEYFKDKSYVYKFQTKNDFLVANQSLRLRIEKQPPASKIIYINSKSIKFNLLHLKGVHNRENAACAFQVGKILNIKISKIKKILQNSRGLPFRQEVVRKMGNITFINDTTSTTPVATEKAIERFYPKGKIILILGGNSKELPTVSLINKLKNVSKIIFLEGSFTRELYDQIMHKYPNKVTSVYSRLSDAVDKAYSEAKRINSKTFVLLSPGATSFATFKNEFDRGEQFNKLIKKL